MAKHQISESEKTNLELHVNMSVQRYYSLEEKVEKISTGLERLAEEIKNTNLTYTKNILELHTQYTNEIDELKDQHNTYIQNDQNFRNETKLHHSQEIAVLREEFIAQSKDTTKVIVGAAATITAGLLSTIVVLLVAFL